MAHRAYEDVALPIGFQQQTRHAAVYRRSYDQLLLAGGPLQRVLKSAPVGLPDSHPGAPGGEVYSVERIRPLQQKARTQRLRQLKCATCT